ncbi:hypothetical protein HanHA89_Chr10g0392351 [Helianthus annuus]|nr:hypothetical protein HanHA89_Chr10g0392351 [Helianthus annuus]
MPPMTVMVVKQGRQRVPQRRQAMAGMNEKSKKVLGPLNINESHIFFIFVIFS